MRASIVYLFIVLFALIVAFYYVGAGTVLLSFVAAGTRTIRQLDTQGPNGQFGNFA